MPAVLPIAIRVPAGQVAVDPAQKDPALTGPQRTGPSLTEPSLTERALIDPKSIGPDLTGPDLTSLVLIDLSQTVAEAAPVHADRTGRGAREVDLRDPSLPAQASHGPVERVPAASLRAARGEPMAKAAELLAAARVLPPEAVPDHARANEPAGNQSEVLAERNLRLADDRRPSFAGSRAAASQNPALTNVSPEARAASVVRAGLELAGLEVDPGPVANDPEKDRDTEVADRFMAVARKRHWRFAGPERVLDSGS